MLQVARAHVACSESQRVVTSTMWDIGDLPKVSMYIEPSVRYQLNDTDSEAEWASLVPENGGVVYIGPDRQPYMPSLFHQLRCLDVLRRAYISLQVPTPEGLDAAALHCLNYIRQMVLCRRDTILERVVDPGGAHAVQPWQTLTCRDWTRVYDAHAHNVRSRRPNIL
ncbi:hypothetical protein C8Q70DRAFT_178696 [Cubamyces menziesii]|nr:hypothetical protein C8Q70DRAFT_178696 [Cubamyces menziesii]